MNENIKAGADINAGDGGYKLGTPEEYDAFVKGRNQSVAMMRIREFARDSRLDVYGLGAKRIPWEDALEKYTQLIVQECLDQLLVSDPTEDFNKGIAWSAKQIKQHFGVEE
jgi:hypothetical protein